MKVHIIGGGCNFYIRPHLALSAPAFGEAAWVLDAMATKAWGKDGDVITHVTRMANGKYLNPDGSGWQLDTNEDIAKFIDTKILPDPEVKVLFMPVALCDFDVSWILVTDAAPGTSGYINTGLSVLQPGKHLPRLKTKDLDSLRLELVPSEKIIQRIRKVRKDVFLVGFKTTTGATPDEQFEAGLRLLKQSSCNLVLANDITSRLNMVITPEQARYHVTKDRMAALEGLVKMTASRADDDFTRSTVVPGDLVPWTSSEVPDSLRVVVNHLIARGAYRPFLGATVGHFAVRVEDGKFLTSVRKTNFNNLEQAGLVKVETKGDNEVVAYGARPSVGGQSQRIIFQSHPGYDCIAHAHIQLKPGSRVPVRDQWPYECGSQSCGQNTSDGLKEFDGIKAVFLDKHGPNIVFNRNVDPQKVIQFIEDNFYVEHQTSELS